MIFTYCQYRQSFWRPSPHDPTLESCISQWKAGQTPHTGHSQRKMTPLIWIQTSGTGRKQTLWEKQKCTLNGIKSSGEAVMIVRNIELKHQYFFVLHLWWYSRRTVALDRWSSCPAVRPGLYSKSDPLWRWCCISTPPTTSVYSHRWTGSLAGLWRDKTTKLTSQSLQS